MICACSITSALKAQEIYLPVRGEWLHLNYGGVFYTPAINGLKQKYSSSVGVDFMQEITFGRSHFSIGYGLGFTSFRLNNNLNIVSNPNAQKQSYTLLSADSSYNKNRQVLQYLEIPIELRYRGKSDQKGRYLRVYPFAKLGYLVESYQQFDHNNYHVIYGNLQDVNRWRITAGLRIGYSFFDVFATYQLNAIYNNVSIGAEDLSAMRALNVGISISL